MRLLYVCPFYAYGNPLRGVNSYEVMNLGRGLERYVEENLGGQFQMYDPYQAIQRIGISGMTNELVELGSKFDVVWHNTWHNELDEAMRMLAGRVTTLGLGFDDIWRKDYARQQAGIHDYWITTCSPDMFDGDNFIHTQFAVEPESYPNLGLERDIDISFIGQLHGKRAEVIDSIRGAGLNIQVYGFGWPGQYQEISHDKMVEIMNRSKICLNMSNNSTLVTAQIKGRVFEIPATGALLLTDPAPNLGGYYLDGKEIVVYDDVPDLINKAERLLGDTEYREQVAKNGFERTLAEHTWEDRLDHIIGRIG